MRPGGANVTGGSWYRREQVGRPIGSPLAVIWATWLMVVLLLGLLHSPTDAPVLASQVLVLFHAGLVLLILGRHFDRTTVFVLGLSLFLRVALVFWDLGFSHIFALPNSGADSEMFYALALEVAKDPALVFGDGRAGAFPKLFGLLFWFIGPLRIFGQYTNALLGFSVVLLVAHILDHLSLSNEQRFRVLAVAALLPNSMVLAAIFLREAIVSFLIAASVYFFVRWFKGAIALNMALAVGAVLAASTFHAGVIAVGVGYLVVALTYSRTLGRFRIGVSSLAYLVFFAVIAYFILAQHPDIFLGKFDTYETTDDILRTANSRQGGSQYLPGLTVSSYIDLVRVGPLRALYFLASPMPWDFRGPMDLVTFAVDSIFYVGVPLLVLVRLRRLDSESRRLAVALLIVLFVSTMVFGAGVSNAGTAARHRFKLISLELTLMAVAFTAGSRSRRASAPLHSGERFDLWGYGESHRSPFHENGNSKHDS